MNARLDFISETRFVEFIGADGVVLDRVRAEPNPNGSSLHFIRPIPSTMISTLYDACSIRFLNSLGDLALELLVPDGIDVEDAPCR